MEHISSILGRSFDFSKKVEGKGSRKVKSVNCKNATRCRRRPRGLVYRDVLLEALLYLRGRSGRPMVVARSHDVRKAVLKVGDVSRDRTTIWRWLKALEDEGFVRLFTGKEQDAGGRWRNKPLLILLTDKALSWLRKRAKTLGKIAAQGVRLGLDLERGVEEQLKLLAPSRTVVYFRKKVKEWGPFKALNAIWKVPELAYLP